jgi:hypothetical protein
MISYEQYRARALAMTNPLPVHVTSVEGYSHSVKCIFRPPEIPALFANDSSSFHELPVGQLGFFSATPHLSVRWDSPSESAIQNSINDVKNVLSSYKSYGDLKWTIKREVRLVNVNSPGFVFVSDTEMLPPSLSKQARTRDAWLCRGIAYASRVLSLPLWRDNIVKFNAVIGPGLPHNLTDLGMPYCWPK